MQAWRSRTLAIQTFRGSAPFYSPFLNYRTVSSFGSSGLSEEDLASARKWHASFNSATDLGNLGDVSYSRSSGPGGQNVNKLNTKAQLRVSLHELLPKLPRALHAGLRNSRYYAQSTDSLLLQADDSRKQAANKEKCYRKLTEMIMDVYKSTIPGETTVEQRDKVRKLQKAENESRLQMKKIHSSKKASRRGSSD